MVPCRWSPTGFKYVTTQNNFLNHPNKKNGQNPRADLSKETLTFDHMSITQCEFFNKSQASLDYMPHNLTRKKHVRTQSQLYEKVPGAACNLSMFGILPSPRALIAPSKDYVPWTGPPIATAGNVFNKRRDEHSRWGNGYLRGGVSLIT